MERENSIVSYYSDSENEAINRHIERFYGKYDKVFHEISSKDVHVDIAVIEPHCMSDCITLVTMGMGARRMNIPQASEKSLKRAELVLYLHPEWKIYNEGFEWKWPVAFLASMAHFPFQRNTWLGSGHTVLSAEMKAKNVPFPGCIFTKPFAEAKGAQKCRLPNGETVNFYQTTMLYEREIEYKIKHGAMALAKKLSEEDVGCIMDVNRECVVGPEKDISRGFCR